MGMTPSEKPLVRLDKAAVKAFALTCGHGFFTQVSPKFLAVLRAKLEEKAAFLVEAAVHRHRRVGKTLRDFNC